MSKVIIENCRSGRFLWKELRFGLDLGQLAVLKKRVWADSEQRFQEQKKCQSFLNTVRVRTKKLHKMKFKKYFFLSNFL